MTARSCATAPPDSPVPAPRARNGAPRFAHSTTTAATSAVPAGKTTARGSARRIVEASHS